MSLTKKLLASFGAMLGLVLLLGAGGLLVTRDLSGDLERAANVTARQQYLAGQVSADSAELTSLERGTVLAAMVADAAHLQAYQQAFGNMPRACGKPSRNSAKWPRLLRKDASFVRRLGHFAQFREGFPQARGMLPEGPAGTPADAPHPPASRPTPPRSRLVSSADRRSPGRRDIAGAPSHWPRVPGLH